MRDRRVTSGALERHARIVHLDDRFVVFDKPAGLSLQTPARDPGAAAERLRAALADEERSRLEGFELHLVHRLDEPTSGLVLVALDADEHRRLSAEFGARRVEKLYLALVWGLPKPWRGSFDSPLGPDRADRRRMRVDPEGRPARSDYLVVAHAPYLSLVALWAATGRTHQLRVHLAAAGHPIVGDDLYGGPRERGVRDARLRERLAAGRALLHAFRLEIPALSPSRFEAPIPADFLAVARAAGLDLAGLTDLWHRPRPVPRDARPAPA